MEDNKLQATDKKEVEAKGELTRAGNVFTPAVDIFEDKNALILIADMPGVTKDSVELHLEENELTLQGHVTSEKPGTQILTEYPVGNFMRKFTLSNVIDQSKIEASMKNGVLRVVLPKAEAVKPKKITIKTN